MLHHLDRRLATSIGERTVDWAVLELGDEIVIGPHRLRFETTGGSRRAGRLKVKSGRDSG